MHLTSINTSFKLYIFAHTQRLQMIFLFSDKKSIREFLGQAWMKSSKKTRAEHISQMTKRFNDGSRLVCSEIISRYTNYRLRAFSNFLIALSLKWSFNLLNEKKKNRIQSGITCKLALRPSKNGQQLPTSAVAYTILMVFYKCVPPSQTQPSFA